MKEKKGKKKFKKWTNSIPEPKTITVTQRTFPWLEEHLGDGVRTVNNVMFAGKDKFPADEWRRQSVNYHLWRSFKHFINWLIGRQNEAHFAHLATRVMLALQLANEKGDPTARADQDLREMLKRYEQRTVKAAEEAFGGKEEKQQAPAA